MRTGPLRRLLRIAVQRPPELDDEIVRAAGACGGAEEIEIGALQDHVDTRFVEPTSVDAVRVFDGSLRTQLQKIREDLLPGS